MTETEVLLLVRRALFLVRDAVGISDENTFLTTANIVSSPLTAAVFQQLVNDEYKVRRAKVVR